VGEESLKPGSTPTGAVFLSYASQDAQPARKICDALRAAGIEVWFDQRELRGGDVWDQKIRRQIHDCALFVPLISANTASRREGYFRLEWDLADQRTHRMARDQTFIVPICLDATPGAGTDVPESFHRVQWTRLPTGETPPEFAEGIKRLLSPNSATTASFSLPAGAASGAAPFPSTRGQSAPSRYALPIALAVLVLAVLAYLLTNKPWISKPAAPVVVSNAASSSGAAPPTDFAPPPHSVAVLPFVNMSGDKSQEYFSDGLTEEILNSLARIGELQVSARTSSFSFKGKDVDLATVGHKLNVGSVLEGSVRRSGQTIRVTAQLNNAMTGFHLWSQTYDRNLGDVLTLQTEIATSVTNALKVTLLGSAAGKVELGGTHNAKAFDAYLRGLRLMRVATSRAEALRPLEAFSEAINLDADFGLAYAARSLAQSDYVTQWAPMVVRRETPGKARLDAERAIVLAPDLGEAHAALARFLVTFALDYPEAWKESERAVTLSPGSATVLYEYSQYAALMGKSGAAIDAARRFVTLDPLNALSHRTLGDALWFGRRYNDAIAAYQDAIAVDPTAPEAYGRRGLAYYALGSYQAAKTACEAQADNWESWLCLAMTDEKLGLHAVSEVQLRRLENFGGDALAYQYAQIEAQRGHSTEAINWLDSALRLRDPGFRRLKTDPLMDPIRNEPRFQAIERELKFPD
jgi:TolB-like protein